MKPTITDETLSCIAQLNADIGELIDVIQGAELIHERLTTLIDQLGKARETA